MQLYKTDKVRFLGGLIIIILIYSLYYLFIVENDIAALIPRKVRHGLTFFVTILIYFVGTYHLGRLKDEWMSSLWHLVHISGLLVITFIGLYDWFILEASVNLKNIVRGVQEILISPVLYVAMGILNKALNK